VGDTRSTLRTRRCRLSPFVLHGHRQHIVHASHRIRAEDENNFISGRRPMSEFSCPPHPSFIDHAQADPDARAGGQVDDRCGSWRPGERLAAGVFSGAMLLAVLSPLLQYRRPPDLRRDGFPLSWYPMFSAKRRRRCWMTYAVGVRPDGSRRFLPSGALGPGGINQVRRQLHRVAVDDRRPELAAAVIARRVGGRRDCRDVVRVEVVRGRYDLDRCLLQRVVNGDERLLAAVEVMRGAAVPA
jgi:hypothetical protein